MNFVEELGGLLGIESATYAVLAQSVVDLYKQGNTSQFVGVFEVVEKHVIYGTDDEQKKVIVEFLEHMKNYAVLTDLDYAVFEEWLGAETFQAWRWLEKHWQGKRSLASAADGTSDRLYLPGKK